MKTNIFYNNFFEWYDKERKAWFKANPFCLYDPGISTSLFVYFISLYLFKGNKYSTNREKLEYVLNKYSKRYFKEKFYLKFFNKSYIDKNWKEYSYINAIEYLKENTSVNDEKFVSICKQYLTTPLYCPDPLGGSQIDLGYLEDILEKHSFRFKREKYLYKLFRK